MKLQKSEKTYKPEAQASELSLGANVVHSLALRACIWRSIGAFAFVLFSAQLVSAEPLLSCGVRQHAKAGSIPEGMGRPFGPPQQTNAWVENYERSGSGEWIATSADPTDDRVQAVLWTPNGPIAIHVEVSIDGAPFRQVREKLIAAANNKPSVKSNVVTDPKNVSKPQSKPTADTEQVAPTVSTKAGLLPRLKSHFRNRELDTEEAQWLLNEWIPGPTLIRTKSGYAAERAKLSPVFAALDNDGDGNLSRDELQQTQARLLSLDKDENAVVERSELATQTNDAIWYPAELFSLFEGTGHISKSQYDSLPAIELRASFGKQNDKNELELVRIDPRITKEKEIDESLFAIDDALVIERPRYRIEIVACQAADYGESHGQISMGAVVDGCPLWRDLDQDGNGRLERLERTRLAAIWKERDLNRDGTIEPSELRSPIRLAIGCGPSVHKELANSTTAITRTSEKATPLPEWFVSMDLNQDSELSRTEFIGTDEQFSELDIDRDNIIGSNEIPSENK